MSLTFHTANMKQGSVSASAGSVDLGHFYTPTSNTVYHSHFDTIRTAVTSAPEQAVALVYFLPSELSFDIDAACLPAGKLHISACKSGGTCSEESIMNGPFKTVNTRALACTVTSGIPGYYRYALHVERGSVSQICRRRLTLRLATLEGFPALRRLVSTTREDSAFAVVLYL
ncbi:hypothetical protein R3P38DRAFT_3262745 [Favolaschia claudopus]|uniref:Uncharacterized protein n=1 Tax=Favolaschia claudopus TaxID=2862362 RepID=A0AAW0CHG2_9AGAR